MATKKAAKQVQVIARYAHKTDGKLNGIVTYAVPAKRSEDISARGSLNGSSQTAQMPAWLAILPSRNRVATHA